MGSAMFMRDHIFSAAFVDDEERVHKCFPTGKSYVFPVAPHLLPRLRHVDHGFKATPLCTAAGCVKGPVLVKSNGIVRRVHRLPFADEPLWAVEVT